MEIYPSKQKVLLQNLFVLKMDFIYVYYPEPHSLYADAQEPDAEEPIYILVNEKQNSQFPARLLMTTLRSIQTQNNENRFPKLQL